MTRVHPAVVVGAGPAGLAAGAMLRRRGVDALLIDRGQAVGDSWRQHYDRLHLHTVRWLSDLPGLPIPRSEGKWVSRDGVARYLEASARHHRLPVQLRTEARRIVRSNGSWSVQTSDGQVLADRVVVATGFNRTPWMPRWPGAETFTGDLLHSSTYRNPEPFRGRDVLVIGTGNSGAEIVVDLVQGGARTVSLSVRTPPNIIRRDLAGFPSQVLGVLFRRFPPALVDPIAVATRRVTVGDLTRYGMPPPPRGLYTRARDDDIIPILDVGLIDLLKQRRVQVVPAVEGFESSEVLLAGGRRLPVDAVIAGTGFRRGLEDLVGHLDILDARGKPQVHGAETHPSAPGLHFIGFTNPISGNLRELGFDAKRIARAVARKRSDGG